MINQWSVVTVKRWTLTVLQIQHFRSNLKSIDKLHWTSYREWTDWEYGPNSIEMHVHDTLCITVRKLHFKALQCVLWTWKKCTNYWCPPEVWVFLLSLKTLSKKGSAFTLRFHNDSCRKMESSNFDFDNFTHFMFTIIVKYLYLKYSFFSIFWLK